MGLEFFCNFYLYDIDILASSEVIYLYGTSIELEAKRISVRIGEDRVEKMEEKIFYFGPGLIVLVL